MKLDHFCIGTPNVYRTAKRLRDLTGLDTYDAGWYPKTGIGQRVVPLPKDAQYIEIMSVIDMDVAQANPFAMWFHGATRKEVLAAWTLGADSLEELEEIGRRHNAPVQYLKNLRELPDGSTIDVHVATDNSVLWPKGLPNFVYWDAKMHPSRRPAQHRVTPGRIEWVEFGDEDGRLRAWLGDSLSSLPVRVLPKGIGLLAAGIGAADGAVIEIRPPFGD